DPPLLRRPDLARGGRPTTRFGKHGAQRFPARACLAAQRTGKVRTMTPEEHWQQVQALFDAALQRDPAERGPYLNQPCAGDREVQAEVEELLAHDAQATNEDFLATPVLVSEGVDVPSFTGPAELFVRYSPRGLHARGGLGEVHTAWDEQLHRQVALKCIQ